MSAKQRKDAVSGKEIQIEQGGFTRIHHAIMEKLALIKITGYEFACLMALFRETYGYQQKERGISLSRWQELTGIERRNLARTLNHLVEKRIVYKIEGNVGRTNTAIWGFNKYTEQWKVEQRQPIVDDEKVCVETPFAGVCVETPFSDEKVFVETPFEKAEKVYSDTPEKVYSDTPNKDKRNTTTTDSGGSGSGSDFASHPHGDLLHYWQSNMPSPLTTAMIEELEKCYNQFGEDEVIDAIRVAVAADVRTLRYVKGVLNRRRADVNASANGVHNYAGMVLVATGDSHE